MFKKIILITALLTAVAMAKSEVKFDVEGMTCGGCASGINENISEDFPDYIIKADFDSKSMTAKRKSGKDVDVKELIQALDDMGFVGKKVN